MMIIMMMMIFQQIGDSQQTNQCNVLGSLRYIVIATLLSFLTNVILTRITLLSGQRVVTTTRVSAVPGSVTGSSLSMSSSCPSTSSSLSTSQR